VPAESRRAAAPPAVADCATASALFAFAAWNLNDHLRPGSSDGCRGDNHNNKKEIPMRSFALMVLPLIAAVTASGLAFTATLI
jgi:hypothetical protein